ncbi:hypothetical protein CYY_001831 [Polysphondylium violaceum]|uniref:Uncharacterized protein n=1 Tax=Polysphondylium violaceum TaxID=133409 RepID=A0A8J4Q142_9MYCE|nr:hypothetical protein CYY_001831 [Polysphondylium violaceum]
MIHLTLTGDSKQGVEIIKDVIHRKLDHFNYEKEIVFEADYFRFKLWNQGKGMVCVRTPVFERQYYQTPSAMYRGSTLSIITHTIHCEKSFRNIGNWLNEVERYARDGSPAIVIGFYDPTTTTTDHTISYKHYREHYSYPYFEFPLTNDSVQDQFNFEKFILETIELFHLYHFSKIFYAQISNTTTTTAATTITTETTGTTTKTIDEIINQDIPVAFKKKFKSSKQQHHYESMFFRVFRNKVLLGLIFRQVNWIHKRYNVNSYNYYTTPFRLLIRDKKFNWLCERISLQQRFIDNDNDNDGDQLWRRLNHAGGGIMIESFSFTNALAFLKTNNDYQLFTTIYNQFPQSFVEDIYDFCNFTMEYYLGNAPQVLENAVIGGNLQIIKHLVDTKLFDPFSKRSLEFAVVLGYTDIVNYLVFENKFIEPTSEEYNSLITLANKYQPNTEMVVLLTKISTNTFDPSVPLTSTSSSSLPSSSFFKRLVKKFK